MVNKGDLLLDFSGFLYHAEKKKITKSAMPATFPLSLKTQSPSAFSTVQGAGLWDYINSLLRPLVFWFWI